MVKICKTGLLILTLKSYQNNAFSGFCQKFPQAMHEDFQILGPLGCQRWVVIPQNVKIVKITAPYCAFLNRAHNRMVLFLNCCLHKIVNSTTLWVICHAWVLVNIILSKSLFFFQTEQSDVRSFQTFHVAVV